MSSSLSTPSSVNNIPEHLIIDHILPRLPVKSLIRFKTVCKSWGSIISSIDFAKSHLKFSSLNPNFLVGASYTYKLWLLDNNNELIAMDLPRKWRFKEIDLVGCSNGLICFYIRATKRGYGFRYRFRVWNPLTCKCRTVWSPVKKIDEGEGEADVRYLGFHYVSSIDDYIIVAPVFDNICELVNIFSLRSGNWRRIQRRIRESFDIFIPPRDSVFCVLCPLEKIDWWREYERIIVGFDLADAKLKEIPLMDCISQYWWVDIFDLNECVSFICKGDHGEDVWVLKGSDDPKSWVKMFSFNSPEWKFSTMTGTGRCLLKREKQGKIVDLRQDTSDEAGVVFDLPNCLDESGVYVESLISPFIGARPYSARQERSNWATSEILYI